jgi:hypothetical protein
MVRRRWVADTSLRSDWAVATEGKIQMHSATKQSLQTDEQMLNARLARGLRAVAASVIVGGMVIAALDMAPQPSGSASGNEIDRSSSSAIPRVSPASDEGLMPSTGQEDPALKRADGSVENHD